MWAILLNLPLKIHMLMQQLQMEKKYYRVDGLMCEKYFPFGGAVLPPWIYGVKSSLVFCPFLTLTEPLSFRNTEERINSSEIVTPFFPLGLFMIMMLSLY